VIETPQGFFIIRALDEGWRKPHCQGHPGGCGGAHLPRQGGKKFAEWTVESVRRLISRFVLKQGYRYRVKGIGKERERKSLSFPL